MRDFYNIDKSGEVPVVNIRGIIGGGFFIEGVTENGFIAEVEQLGDVSAIEVHISSKGGSVSVGLGIFNYLVNHKARIKTVVFSEASSIASVIALAGDERVMLEGTTMYIHEPLAGVQGYAADLFKTADYLVMVKNSLLDIYERVTGQSRAALIDLLKNETMMNAQEALRRGFITAIETPDTPIVNLMSNADFSGLMLVEAESVVKDNQIAVLEAEVLALKNIDQAAVSDALSLESGSEESHDDDQENAKEQVKAEQTAAKIRGICAAAHVPKEADYYINQQVCVEQVRTELFDMITTGDKEINGSAGVPVVVEQDQKKTVDYQAIYAQRKQANKG